MQSVHFRLRNAQCFLPYLLVRVFTIDDS
jgi:hypothetical protein